MTPESLLPKPRPDAKLKTLPEARQAEIVEFARPHTLAQTVQWLAQTGLKTSPSALSQFLRWYRLKQDLARNEAALHDRLADIVRNDPSRTGERLHQLGQTFFAMSAIEKQDPKAWYLAQTINLRKARS